MKIKDLKNREEVIDAIAKELAEADVERYPFEVDVYLYIDEDGIGSVDTVTNPGGNSWLNDDHITVYRIGQSFAPIWEDMSLADLLECAGKTEVEIRKLIDPEDPGYPDEWDIRHYIGENYEDEVKEAYIDWQEWSDYRYGAEAALDEAERNQAEAE